MSLIFCSCGCGLQLEEFDNRGRKRRQIHGHSKSFLNKHHKDDTKNRLREVFKGKHLSPTTEFKRGENTLEKHPLWKGGRTETTNGYIQISAGIDSKRYEHDVVMERHLGRKLLNNEVVHHINGIKTDNTIENLKLTAISKHTEFHPRERNQDGTFACSFGEQEF